MTSDEAEAKVVETFGEDTRVVDDGEPTQPVTESAPNPAPEQVAADNEEVVEGVEEEAAQSNEG